MSDTDRQIENLFLTVPSHLGELAQQLRDHIKKELHPTREIVFSSYNSLNLGYGFTEKSWDCFCGIIIYSKHINISFPSGAHLKDPGNILKGTGSRVRHIRIDKFDEIMSSEVLEILREARDLSQNMAAEKGFSDNEFKTIIK